MADKKNKTPMYLIDTQSAFYRPLGRRIVICAAAVIWAGLETWHRDPFWSVISVACAVYCVYVLLLSYKPPVDPPAPAPDPEPADDVEENDNSAQAADSARGMDIADDPDSPDRREP